MANTIRLKQGTGSDPSASDLVLGEPAIRTDTGEIFLKKDDGSIAKVAGGIDDGDKGDITVSNDGATFTIDSGAVTYAKMGGISNNRLMGRISSGSGSPETLTPANVRTIINVEDGATADQSASEILTLIKTVDGSGSGLDADLLDGSTGADYLNASNLSSGSVPAARLDTATTQSAGNNSTKIATTAYTDTAISNLINGAPAALDTLNELAAAMNDDAAFSTTVTNSLATKLPLAGGQITGNITCSGSQTFDGRDLSVDGSKLDGIAAGAQVNVGTNLGTSRSGTGVTITSSTGNNTSISEATSSDAGVMTSAMHDKLDGIESGATADQSASEILTLLKTVDGSGSGLDADTLDGVSSGSFARIDGTNMGATTFEVNDADFIVKDDTDSTTNYIWRDHSANTLYLGTANAVVTPRSGVIPSADSTYNIGSSSVRWANGYFDTLHGDGSNLTNLPSQTDNNFTNSDHSKLDGIESGATADQSASEILTLLKTVDGSGSGLDADTLDGLSSSSLLRSNAADTATSDITFSGGAGAISVAANSDIRFSSGSWTGDACKIQLHSNWLYIQGGSSGHVFRRNNGNDAWYIDSSGVLHPAADTTYDIGKSGSQVNNLYVEDVYCSNWFRNSAANEGSYNSATGMHWYSGGAGYYDIGGGQSAQGIRFRDNHNGTIRGYVYYTNSNEIGFLDSDGQWAVKVVRDSRVELCINNTVEASIYPDTIRCEGAFFENNQTVTADKTISDGYNAMSAGPITVNNSVTVTVGSGEVWTII